MIDAGIVYTLYAVSKSILSIANVEGGTNQIFTILQPARFSLEVIYPGRMDGAEYEREHS